MYRAGISLDEFGKLTMRKIKIISNAYSEKLHEDFRLSDLRAYVQGIYVVEAILCTIGNMTGGKHSYPKQAYSMNVEKELTEDEIELQRQQFIAALQTMQHNFNINKEKQKIEDSN